MTADSSEAKLRQQIQHSASLLELSPVAIVIITREGLVRSWNPAAERLFGYTTEEALDASIDDLVARSEEVRAEALSYTRQAGATGHAYAITRRTRKDGTFVDVELIAAPLAVDGEQVGSYAIYHDVSELQRQRQYHQALLETSPAAIVTIDLDGRVTTWNQAAVQLFGYSVDEAAGRNIDDLVASSQELRDEAIRYTEQAAETGHAYAIARRLRRDGSLVDVELKAVALTIGGDHFGTLVVYHDITELQRARREADAAARAKSAFLATMSHEIRTPMNAVIGMTGLLLDTELSDEQRHYAEIIGRSGDALLALINDILDLSKIEAGRLELDSRPVDLGDCVASSLELVAVTAAAKGLELAYDISPAVPGWIDGDETRLRQILVNLLWNAVKFTDEGEVVVTVDAAPTDTHGTHRVSIAVRDTGMGIPADRLEDLFESFTQVDDTRTRKHGGTGLGLAISRRLAELMGGTITVQSTVAAGSTFHVTFVADEVPPPASAHDRGPMRELTGLRVLVVDDNATNREIIGRWADSWGLRAHLSASPHEAIECIRRGDPFDLIVVDVVMPELDGLDLTREIRRHRGAADTAVILLTSLGTREDTEGLDVAAQLTKPLRASELYDVIITLFGAPSSDPSGDGAARDAAGASLDVLVAEDNAVNQELAMLLLQKAGHRADVVGDGREALAALDRRGYDVVLMDVQMPEMDGLAAARTITAEHPPDARPWIIALTANATPEDRQACMDAGMDDYLAKPIRPEELDDALRRVPRAAPDEQTLDPAAFGRLVEAIGAEAAAALATTFFRSARDMVATLERALGDGDAPEVQRVAHTLKSNAATFGATALKLRSQALETAAREGDLGAAEALAPLVVSDYEQAVAALTALIGAQRPTGVAP